MVTLIVQTTDGAHHVQAVQDVNAFAYSDSVCARIESEGRRGHVYVVRALLFRDIDYPEIVRPRAPSPEDVNNNLRGAHHGC